MSDKIEIRRFLPCNDKCRSSKSGNDPTKCCYGDGNEGRLIQVNKSGQSILPIKGSPSLMWHGTPYWKQGHINNERSIAIARSILEKHTVLETNLTKEANKTLRSSCTCTDSELKLVPLGIGPACPIIKICISCGEEKIISS